MISEVLFLIPPLLNALAISRSDITCPTYALRAIIFSLIIASTTHGIFYPPSNNALVNYANGLFLSWYVVWSANTLFIYDIRSLRRLQMRSVQGHGFCYWEPIHETSGMRRLIWALDLSTNFRGLGWMSSKPGVSWPTIKHRWCPTTSYGLARRIQKVAADCLIFCGVRFLVHESPNIPHGTLQSSTIPARS